MDKNILTGLNTILLLISFIGFSASPIQYERQSQETVASDHLQLHYKFDDPTGATEIIDYSGNGRTGSISDGANISLGVVDDDLTSVLQKTGAGSITVPGYQGIGGNAPRTITFYFKQEELGFRNIFRYGDEDLGLNLLNITPGGKLRFVNKVGGSFIEGNIAVPINEWVHVAWVIKAGTNNTLSANLYINGFFEASTPSAGFENVFNTVLSEDVAAVDDYDGSYFMSDLRVFSKPLVAEEIRDLLLIRQDQEITFNLAPNVNADLVSLPLRGIASSALPITYESSNPSVATVSGSVLNIIGEGTTQITALQTGSQLFKSAEPIVHTLKVQPATEAGTPFDLKAFIDSEIAQGKKEITLPGGRIRLPSTEGNIHLPFENLQDITIFGNHTEIVFTETLQGIRLLNCSNVKIQDFSIDYDPLPFTQAIITSISGNKTQITAQFLDGYSTTVRNSRIEIYNGKSAELSASTYYGVTFQVDEQAREVIINKTRFDPAYSFEKVGDIVVIDSRGSRNIPHGILMEGCTDMVLDNVTLFSGTAFGFFERYCSNSLYSGCQIIRRPIESELVPREMRRMRSINLDGFHSKHASIGPTYTECLVGYNGDDGIAVNGDYHIITETNENQLTVIGKAGLEPNIEVGDSVELVSYSGERVPNGKVQSISVGRAVIQSERNFLNNQIFNGEAEDTPNAINTYTIVIDRAIDLPLGSLIASANRLGNGVKVMNCTVGPTRSRGILIKSSDVLVSGNTVIGTWGQGIKMSPEYSWLEAGTGENIKVVNNTVSDSHEAAIAIYAIGGNRETGLVGSHRNVEIIENQISGSVNPGIAVTSTSDLFLENNTITNVNNSYIIPGIEDFGYAEDPSREIYLENVEMRIVVVGPLLGLEEAPLSITVYPNPVSDLLSILPKEGIPEPYIIYDSQQRVIFKSPAGDTNLVDVSSWSEGIYFLRTVKHTYKIIKRYH